jgi:flavin reductase (DIM6/NTAB) family NADH-FMN oxidoreductase RutF
MFYEPKKKNHGLSRNPFNSLVIPRPIGWISSVDVEGIVNLAPYSFFNAICYRPPTVMFSSGASTTDDGKKDSVRNIEATGEFVCNVVTWDLRDQMNETSATLDKDIDELALAGLTPTASRLVGPPRVAEAPVHLECTYIKSIDIPHWGDTDRYILVLGEVIGIHIKNDLITEEGLIDITRMRPVGRLGYNDYTNVSEESCFTMVRPP